MIKLTESVESFTTCTNPVTNVYGKITLASTSPSTSLCVRNTATGALLSNAPYVTALGPTTWLSCDLLENDLMSDPNAYYKVETYINGSLNESTGLPQGGTLVAKSKVIVNSTLNTGTVQVSTVGTCQAI